MKFKPDENMLVAYLYGELNQKENERVEYYLDTHPEMKQEYENMVSLRKLLQRLPDQEIRNPIILGPGKGESSNLLTWPFFRKVASVAAVLLVLMLGGKLTDTRFSLNESGFTLAFDEEKPNTPAPQASSPDLEEVNLMITEALSRFKANEWDSLSQQHINTVKELRVENETKQLQQMEQFTIRSRKLMESYYKEMAEQNRKTLGEFLLMASHQQAGQTEAMLNQFAQRLQQMREEDLVYLQTRLHLIEEDKNLFQYETGKVLSDLIYHAANQERQ